MYHRICLHFYCLSVHPIVTIYSNFQSINFSFLLYFNFNLYPIRCNLRAYYIFINSFVEALLNFTNFTNFTLFKGFMNAFALWVFEIASSILKELLLPYFISIFLYFLALCYLLVVY